MFSDLEVLHNLPDLRFVRGEGRKNCVFSGSLPANPMKGGSGITVDSTILCIRQIEALKEVMRVFKSDGVAFFVTRGFRN